MWTLYAIALFLLQVLSGSLGNVLLGKWNETVLACSSNTELTFKFKSSQSTKYIAIAQCDLVLKSCQLMDTVLRNKYNISYTGRGGLLYIISQDNDSNGTYTCSETYNSDIFASTNVTSFHVADTTKPASVECSSKDDITFRYNRRNTNTSRSLAECDHTLRACHMLETDAKNKYTISYTGRGGILRVNNLEDETIGTYTCCETYSPNNCISTDVIGYYTDELRNSSDGVYYVDYTTTATFSRGYNTDNQTNTLTIVLPICAVLLVVLIVICVVIYLVKKRNRRRKGHDSNRQSLSMLPGKERLSLIDGKVDSISNKNMGEGNSKRKLSTEKMDSLEKETTFPRKTIKRWYKAYMVAFPDGMMDKETFEPVYSQCVPKGNPGLFKERAFRSGERIDFDLFVLTIHKTSSATREENVPVVQQIITGVAASMPSTTVARMEQTTATKEELDFTVLTKEICDKLRQWINGEISEKACIDKIMGEGVVVAAGSFVGSKVGGAIGGPSGATVGAAVGAVVLPITAKILKDKLKEWIFGCTKEKALEQAYTFVGLPAKATNKEINSRYRKLARKYHPDKKGELEKWIQLQYSMELIRESRR